MAGNRIATAIKTIIPPNFHATLPPPPPHQAGEKTLVSKPTGVNFAGTSEARTFDSIAPADATATYARQVDTKLPPPTLKTPPGHTIGTPPASHALDHIQQTLQMDFLQVNVTQSPTPHDPYDNKSRTFC